MRNAASLVLAAFFAACLPGVSLAAQAAKPAQTATPAAQPAAAKAQQTGQVCIGVVNHTGQAVRIGSKTGSLTFLEVAPRTIDSFCCPTHEKLCFDKSDGTTKVKAVRIEPGSPDEWSGDTCRKLYLKPGATISVRLDMDGRHIVCEPTSAEEHARPFEHLDLDRDGGLTEAEAASGRIPPATFRDMDLDGDGKVTHTEYKSAFSNINVLKGVPF